GHHHSSGPDNRTSLPSSCGQGLEMTGNTGGPTPVPTLEPAPQPDHAASPHDAAGRHRLGDVLFRGASSGSALLILLVLAGVGTFLVVEALPVASASAEDITGGEGFLAYIWPLMVGTVV